MNDVKKFKLGKAPFIRKADGRCETTTSFMRDFMIALAPLIIFAWIKNGLLPFLDKNTNFIGMIYPLLLIVFGAGFSILLEFLWYAFIIKTKPLKERMATSYAAIPGLLLGMIVPLATPIWVLFLGCFFATVIAKLMFGGFGNNLFNPALIGYLFLTYAYYGLLTSDVSSITGITANMNVKGFLNGTENSLKLFSGATPMTYFSGNKFDGVKELISEYGLLNMFLGFTPGAVAETSALLCLVALIYLLVRKVINWRIPVIYIGTVFVLTYIIGAFNGFAGTLDYALFGILNGGLMFGAVFMATEPVTSPRNPNGKVIYALALGILTVVFRFASGSPEGVATSILLMNVFTAIIEKFASKVRVEPNKKKMLLNYALVGVLFLGIASFPIIKNIPAKATEKNAIEFLSNEQDFSSLDFIYKFKSGEDEIIVTTDQTNKILKVSLADYNNDTSKEIFKELINKNRLVNYVSARLETADELVLTVKTKGYASVITTTIKYNNAGKIIELHTEYDESYDEEYNDKWAPVNGHPNALIPGRIIANQDDLDKVEAVSGATITSNAIVEAARIGNKYLGYFNSLDNLTLISKTQNYETLEFVYIFRNKDGKLLVNTSLNYEITSSIDEAKKTLVEEAINKNKFKEYIKSKTDTTIEIVTSGFNGDILSNFTFDENFKITSIQSNTDDESYEYGEWNSADGHPNTVLPSQIIANQENDLNAVNPITGATVTSNAIIRAAKIALEYLKVMEASHA